MTLPRQDIVEFLDHLLLSDFSLKDATHNGLQIEGKEHIQKIAFSVDASIQTFEEALDEGADLIVTHHGLIWGGWSQISGNKREALKLLLENEINLYVSHLPLDFHPRLGNNIQILKSLGGRVKGRFAEIGYIAEWPALSYGNLISLVKEKIGEPVAEMPFGPSNFKEVGIISGSFSLSLLEEAIQSGIPTLLTGEGSSLLYHTALEYGVNLIFGGHYATETFGVKALMKELQQHFEIESVFLDLPTGW